MFGYFTTSEGESGVIYPWWMMLIWGCVLLVVIPFVVALLLALAVLYGLFLFIRFLIRKASP